MRMRIPLPPPYGVEHGDVKIRRVLTPDGHRYRIQGWDMWRGFLEHYCDIPDIERELGRFLAAFHKE